MKDLLEYIGNEAARGLDEGDTREALTTIKWKVKDALRAGTLGDRMIDGGYQRELKASAAALADSFPEINLSNYTDDDVSALNNWGFEVVDALRAAVALTSQFGPKHQATGACAESESMVSKSMPEMTEQETERAIALGQPTLPAWDYVSEPIVPGRSWNEVLSAMGDLGWEAWHIQTDESGVCEIYFKRPRPPAATA